MIGKVTGSNPCRSSRRILFSRVNFLCWLLFQYPFHPCVTAVACKRSWSFSQKCRWQVSAKHTYTLLCFHILAGTEIPGGMGRGRLYLTLHCHHQNDSCIKMGSNERHFNVALIVRDKVTRQCPQTTTLFKRGELTESNQHLFAYQPNALLLGQTCSHDIHPVLTAFFPSHQDTHITQVTGRAGAAGEWKHTAHSEVSTQYSASACTCV